jgi:hypothetical protein
LQCKQPEWTSRLLKIGVGFVALVALIALVALVALVALISLISLPLAFCLWVIAFAVAVAVFSGLVTPTDRRCVKVR